MYARFLSVPALALTVLLTACEDKSSGPAANDKKSLLVGAKWKETAATVAPPVDLEGDGVMVTDLHAAFGPCVADNVLSFKADGTWSSDEGASKCDPDDPQTETGTWTLSADGSTLTMVDSIGTDNLKVLELSSSTLKASGPVDFLDGVVHTATVTYKAQ